MSTSENLILLSSPWLRTSLVDAHEHYQEINVSMGDGHDDIGHKAYDILPGFERYTIARSTIPELTNSAWITTLRGRPVMVWR
jgi:hypothetical protein